MVIVFGGGYWQSALKARGDLSPRVPLHTSRSLNFLIFKRRVVTARVIVMILWDIAFKGVSHAWCGASVQKRLAALFVTIVIVSTWSAYKRQGNLLNLFPIFVVWHRLGAQRMSVEWVSESTREILVTVNFTLPWLIATNMYWTLPATITSPSLD